MTVEARPRVKNEQVTSAGPPRAYGWRSWRLDLMVSDERGDGRVAQRPAWTLTLHSVVQEGRNYHGEVVAQTADRNLGLTYDGTDIVLRENVSLLYGQARRQVATKLAERTALDEPRTWEALLDNLGNAAITGLRSDEAPVSLATVESHGDIEWLFTNRLPRGRAITIYSPGGVGKTTLADGLTLSAATGTEVVPGFAPTESVRVGILDWDEGPDEHGVRIASMCRSLGIEVPEGISYRHATRPVVDLANEYGRWVADEGIGLLILDPGQSALRQGPGDPAEPVRELYEWLAAVKVSAVILDHVSGQNVEAGGTAKKAYGSIYKMNRARGAFQIDAVEAEPGSRLLRVTNTKPLALLPPIPPFGVRITYTPAEPPYERITFTAEEVPIILTEGAGKDGIRPAIVGYMARIIRRLWPHASQRVASDILAAELRMSSAQLRQGVKAMRDAGLPVVTEYPDGRNKPATYWVPDASEERPDGP